MVGSRECVQVKQEDLDWLVYHLLLARSGQDRDDLAAEAGCSRDDLESSIARLESSLLITRSGEEIRVVSIPEFILACQSRYDTSAPFVIEGGIIREKKDRS